MMRPVVLRYGEMRVPHVIAWSGEAVPQPLVFKPALIDGPRLSYVDPRPSDWVAGVLRARIRTGRHGEPMWRMLNTKRQWECMEALTCQVCAGPAIDLVSGRIWWVITETGFRATSEDGGRTNAPPTCVECIPESLVSCPQLRKSSAVHTVAAAVPVGVLAEVFEPGLDGRAHPVGHNVYVGLDEFARHPRILATQLVVQLHDMWPERL